MSGVHTKQSGFLTKTALPTVVRPRGTETTASSAMFLAGDIIPSWTTTTTNYSSFAVAYPSSQTITINGYSSCSPDSPFNGYYGSYSGQLYGNTNYMTGSMSIAANNVIQIGATDFTVEFWLYSKLSWGAQASSATVMGHSSTGGKGVMVSKSGTKLLFRLINTVNVDLLSNSTPATAAWEHWAFVRSGTTLKIYKNGVLDNSTTQASATDQTDTTATLYFGYHPSGSNNSYLDGKIACIRWSNTAIYTNDFTPSTTPLTTSADTICLIEFNNLSAVSDSSSPRADMQVKGVTTSTTYTKYQPYSFYFNGSSTLWCSGLSDWLQPQASGQYTIEWWMYLTANPANTSLILGPASGGTTIYGGSVYINNSRAIGLWSGIASAGGVWNTNEWVHCAVVKYGSATGYYAVIYVNGVPVAQGTNNIGMQFNSTLLMGGTQGNGYSLVGYISEFRVTKGLVYSRSFTPPQAALTNVAAVSPAVVNAIYGINQLA